ncbi:epimerase [Flavipsychrobacter stenotrophus]|uniref:GDP-mannose 4,6-dehydratase n=1 Tax=Flavipsychrobacter stenotrophus TaxID=2077091 RepID=A0A2S7SU21_9BACT|nr:GDP-mannose 4,6-dehydratase [Flavipsychrobacter stenotrophus]PQJ10422.1 epimerase [Flavipsychrobacter stenotrophus]
MVALIFGANGQDGYYLDGLLRAKGIEVVGVSRSGNWAHGDVSNFADVEALVRTHTPDYIFHLAANSTTRHDVLFENHATISTGAFNVLEAVRQHAPACKVFLSGSGLQFKNVGLPIKETDEFEASSPYSVSRIQSVYAARYYRSLGVRAYVGYFFNHESPRRPERHMSKKIACAALRIGNGSTEQIEIGDITVKKEWAFAGDIVAGIWALVQQDNIFEATIGSGLAYSIEDWLVACFAIAGKRWQDHVTIKSGFKAEYDTLVSDPSTLISLGWKPEVSFSSLAKMMMQ